ncbi:MAG TPA: hypothetical protein VM120_08240, partial [Bryobacteraceae bacterium]|nr:hypothetical protein [Bryobacteraceae bacterium]
LDPQWTSIARMLLLLCAVTASGQMRPQIYRALQTGKALDPHGNLLHLSHTCTLKIEGQFYPVIEVQEIIKSAAAQRGVNHIVVLDAKLKVMRKIGYTTQRPLFCIDNRLFLFGDLAIEGVQPEGNVLHFTNGAQALKTSRVEPTNYPLRKGLPQ